MSTWSKYRRTNIAEMRPYIPGECLDNISVSSPDQVLDPEEFRRGFIARNPQNHKDQWYVARAYFDVNFEPIDG